jgi:DNA-binding response OmpR family regulator
VRRQAARLAPAIPESQADLPEADGLPQEPGADLPTLLLVEDNPDVVEFLTACLKQQYNLEFAFNGRAGIEKALQHIPDLVVSDVMMPEKDGFEVCQTLKEDERTSHIPIVLLTAKAGVESRIAGLRRGADAYLAKPFHQEELLATLTNLLELRRRLQAKYAQTLYQPAPEPVTEAAPDPEDAFLQKICAVVEANLGDENFESANLEQALAMSRSQIFRKVKALTGHSPSLFIRSIRLHHGRHLLQTTTKTVSEIAFEVGFSSPKYFSDAFAKEFGHRPTDARGE